MVKRIIGIGSILISLIPAIGVKAATFNETAVRILKESPGFESQEYSLETTFRNLNMASNLPDPEVGGEYLVAPVAEDNRWAAELNWGIEWPGVYRARNKEAKSKMSVAEKQIMAQRADKLAEIKDLLLDFIRCRQKISLLEELSNNNDTIYHLAEEAARGGELTVLDLNKIKLEYANIRVSNALLLDEQAEIVANLSQIYGRDCMPLLENLEPKFPELTIPSEEEIARIKEYAPSIQAAKAEAESALAARKVAKMEALPSLSVGYKHQYEEGTHFNGAVVGVSIPIFSSRGKQKAAKAEILEAQYNVEAAATEIESDAMATLRRLKLINRQIEEIAPIVENADYNATLLKAYKGGALTLIEYIADRNYFTNAAVELVTLRHNAAKTLAFLQRYLVTSD